jgi:hypothetical protein
MFLLEMQLGLARKTEWHDLFEKIVRKSSANAENKKQIAAPAVSPDTTASRGLYCL